MEIIKVAIVEDDQDWVKAMALYLSSHSNIEFVGSANDRASCIALVKSVEIDVMLMDINLHGSNEGIFLTLDILKLKPLKVIMLTSLKEAEIIQDAFNAGAVEYIQKENFYDLPFIIQRVYTRNSPIEILAAEFQKLKKEALLKNLSRSEKEIFDYLSQGLTPTQIEPLIFKTKNTIKQQIRSILKKLHVRSSKEAVKKVNSGGIYKNTKIPE